MHFVLWPGPGKRMFSLARECEFAGQKVRFKPESDSPIPSARKCDFADY